MVDRGSEERWIDWQVAPATRGNVADYRDLATENLELLLFTLGHKPAVKVEDQDSNRVDELCSMASRGGFFFEAIARDSGPTPEERDMNSGQGSSLSQVFLSRDEAAIPLLIEMERLERRGGNQRRKAIIRSGEILGYPSCCVSAFANLRRQDDEAVLDTYRASLGPAIDAAPIFNIFPPMVSPITWYPCSFQCSASLAQAGEVATEMQALDKKLTAQLAHLEGITLVFERFLFVHLHGATKVEGKLEYRAASDTLSWTRDPLFVESSRLWAFRRNVTEQLASAGSLRLERGGIELQSQGGDVAHGAVNGDPLIFTFATP